MVSDSAPDPRLDDRVMELLTEHPGRLAFNGLRRTLGAHPESLSRALRRLEREGRVTHDADGYALRLDGETPITPGRSAEREPPHLVASVHLPAGVGGDSVLGAMAGRWFGPLRWVGVYEHPGEPTLVWSAGGGAGHVLLSTRRGQLRVSVEGVASSEERADAEAAARELLAHALARMRPADRAVADGARWFSAGPPTARAYEN